MGKTRLFELAAASTELQGERDKNELLASKLESRVTLVRASAASSFHASCSFLSLSP